MFGREYRVPLDVLFNVRNDNRRFASIAEYERTLKDLYEVARSSMNARQAIAATYYDKKVLDDELNVDEHVFMFAPRNKSKKLALKWFGPYQLIRSRHPAYEIQAGKDTKWVTRDKLKRAPPQARVVEEEPVILEPPIPIETEVVESSDSDSDAERPEVDRGRGIYRLRPNPPRPQLLNEV